MSKQKLNIRARVFLDCDSTLSAIEGYDELAKVTHCFREVAKITNATMNKGGDLKVAIKHRLDLIKPNLAMISQLSKSYIKHAIPQIKVVITKLQEQGYNPTIVSAGPKPAIIPFALMLNINVTNVYAIDLDFCLDGTYQGLAKDNPIIKYNGKIKLCQSLLAKDEIGIIVGDGMSDVVTKKDNNMFFIHYAGVLNRKNVSNFATSTITSKSIKELPYQVNNIIKQIGINK